jgi:hypothetical protein
MLLLQVQLAGLQDSLTREQSNSREAAAQKASLELELQEQSSSVREANGETSQQLYHDDAWQAGSVQVFVGFMQGQCNVHIGIAQSCQSHQLCQSHGAVLLVQSCRADVTAMSQPCHRHASPASKLAVLSWLLTEADSASGLSFNELSCKMCIF